MFLILTLCHIVLLLINNNAFIYFKRDNLEIWPISISLLSFQKNADAVCVCVHTGTRVFLCYKKQVGPPPQSLNQDLETGCPKLAMYNFWAAYFSKEATIYSDYNHIYICIYLLT